MFRHLLRNHFSVTTFWPILEVIVSGVQGYFSIGVFAGFLSAFSSAKSDFLAEAALVRPTLRFFKSKKWELKNRVPDQLKVQGYYLRFLYG